MLLPAVGCGRSVDDEAVTELCREQGIVIAVAVIGGGNDEFAAVAGSDLEALRNANTQDLRAALPEIRRLAGATNDERFVDVIDDIAANAGDVSSPAFQEAGNRFLEICPGLNPQE